MASKFCKLHTCLLFIAILFSVDASRGIEKSCNVTKQIAKKLFISSDGAHNTSITDNSLQVCEKNNTCCTRKMEIKLEKVSEDLRKSLFKSMHNNIQHRFSSTARNFSGFFSNLIENAYKDVDQLYTRTYADKYTKNKAIFRHLYSKLREYINGTEQMDLKQLVDSWFSMLYQKVFMISNEDKIYDASYQHCILETAEMIRPFGDTPRRVGVQVKKSFLASKVIIEALNSGHKVVEALLNIKINKQCVDAFAKMTMCDACVGAMNTRPCHNYCLNVMKGCTAYPAAVAPSWSTFLNAVTKLANKIDGPFSMETVIRPLGVEISSGLMRFQFNRDNITAMVEKKCGIPLMKKTKSVKRRSLKSDEMSYPYNFLGMNNEVRPTTAYGTSLYRLIKSLKSMIIEVKNHWTAISHTVCSSGVAAPQTETENCWNGKSVDRRSTWDIPVAFYYKCWQFEVQQFTVAHFIVHSPMHQHGYVYDINSKSSNNVCSYMHPVVKDGFEEMFQNPEVHLEIKEPVPRQVLKLKDITQRILMAINGADSNGVDQEDGSGDSGEGSGGGSGDGGSGSGDGTTDPGSGQLTTPWPAVVSTSTITDINNNVETDPFVPSATQNPNEIPGKGTGTGPGTGNDSTQDKEQDPLDNGTERSIGRPDNGATTNVATVLSSLFCFIITGLLLL
eukprot:gene11301-12483_t